MAQEWARRTALLEVDTATLERLLAPRWPGARVISAEPLPGGHANTNYRVTLNAHEAPVVVRFYTRDPQSCAREAALLQLVASAVPVPTPLYVEPEAVRFEHPYIVLSWMEGTPLLDLMDTLTPEDAPSLAASLGTVAAAIGSFTFADAGFLDANLNISERLVIGPEELPRYLRELLVGKRAGAELGAEYTHRLLSHIDTHADELAPLLGCRSLIHADYRDGNLLVSRDANGYRVSGVLDWEFAFSGPSIFDLGSLLRREAILPAGFAAQCIAAYRAHGGYAPAGWRHMTLMMDLINLCDFLNSDHVQGRMQVDITSLIRASVERLERDETDERM